MVSSSNSLVGSQNGDSVGNYVGVALTNGNYVVPSPAWDNDSAIDAGAVTWGNGSTGISGVVSSSNSLVGSAQNDRVGGAGTWALKNGNFVVLSNEWNNGSVSKAGAATWGNGTAGISGIVSSNNSLVGSIQNDQVGVGGLTELSNGNFLVGNPFWDNGSAIDAGALTWVNGATGIVGVVSASNSLVGTSSQDLVGTGFHKTLLDGNYMVISAFWDSPNTPNVGAVIWGNGSTGVKGPINSNNGVIGKVDQGSSSILPYYFDPINQQMVVGLPRENTVVLYRLTPAEIDVTGNGIAIPNGDNSPVSNDGSDLGSQVMGSGALTQSFTISNTGDGVLTIDAITLSGAQAGDFSISDANLPKVLAPNSSLAFTLNFTPSVVGLRSATVNIASDDGDENPYTFAVQGTGSQALLSVTNAYLPIIVK